MEAILLRGAEKKRPGIGRLRLVRQYAGDVSDRRKGLVGTPGAEGSANRVTLEPLATNGCMWRIETLLSFALRGGEGWSYEENIVDPAGANASV